MALRYTDKPFKSSFTEDDIYFYEREWDELDAMAAKTLDKSDFSEPLSHLDPSDEDNGLFKLGDFIPPKKWGLQEILAHNRPLENMQIIPHLSSVRRQAIASGGQDERKFRTALGV